MKFFLCVVYGTVDFPWCQRVVVVFFVRFFLQFLHEDYCELVEVTQSWRRWRKRCHVPGTERASDKGEGGEGGGELPYVSKEAPCG